MTDGTIFSSRQTSSMVTTATSTVAAGASVSTAATRLFTYGIACASVLVERRPRRAIRHRRLDERDALGSKAVERQVPARQRGARRRRLERDDASAGPAPARGEDGVDAHERADVEDDVARANRVFEKLKERRLGLVRHQVADARVDADDLVVHLPGQAAPRVARAEEAAVCRREERTHARL